jgi:3-deoxy-D-manno-octulosonic-acid transferase
MPGEEKFLTAAIRELGQEFPRLLTILAPRHPERFSSVAEELRAAGIPFVRRSAFSMLPPVVSKGSSPGSDPQPKLELPGVLLLDSIGELGAVYELADVAFVGGTLVPTGGHNILEPATFGKAVVIGPSMSNFQDIADTFLRDAKSSGIDGARMGAVVQLMSASSFSSALRYLFRNPALCRRLGEAARALVENEINPMERIRRELERLTGPTNVQGGSVVGVPGTAVADARPLREATRYE